MTRSTPAHQEENKKRSSSSDADSLRLASTLLQIRSEVAHLASTHLASKAPSPTENRPIASVWPTGMAASGQQQWAPPASSAAGAQAIPIAAAASTGGLFSQMNLPLAPSQLSSLQAMSTNPLASFLAPYEFLGNHFGTHRQLGQQESVALLQQRILASQSQGETDGSMQQASNKQVRAKQVEAALRSKPQRGRKREDLNEMERLELTRTRNREHAKSTRIKKKARYQELLDEERHLKDFRTRASLDQERRTSVLQYVTARQQMLLKLRRRPEGYTCSGDTAHADKATSRTTNELMEVVSQVSYTYGNQDMDEGAAPLDRMMALDEILASRIQSRFGNDALEATKYVVRGEEKGVSLDSLNGGFAEVDVIMTLGQDTPALSGLLKVEFSGPESSKLSSTCWCPMKDFLAQPQDPLTAQVSHPSVVSLDPALLADAAPNVGATARAQSPSNDDTNAGPGMNI